MQFQVTAGYKAYSVRGTSCEWKLLKGYADDAGDFPMQSEFAIFWYRYDNYRDPFRVRMFPGRLHMQIPDSVLAAELRRNARETFESCRLNDPVLPFYRLR
jgi:hypothetical protein